MGKSKRPKQGNSPHNRIIHTKFARKKNQTLYFSYAREKRGEDKKRKSTKIERKGEPSPEIYLRKKGRVLIALRDVGSGSLSRCKPYYSTKGEGISVSTTTDD